MIAVVISCLESSISQSFSLSCGSHSLLFLLLLRFLSLMQVDIGVLIRAKQSTVTLSQPLEKP